MAEKKPSCSRLRFLVGARICPLRTWVTTRKRVRQHLGLGLEDVAIPVLVAGHAQGQLSITAATELEELAYGDLLKLDGGGMGEFGLVILWRMLGSLGAGLGPAASTWFCGSDSFFMPGLSHGGMDNGSPTLKIIVAGKRGLIEDVAVEGADQANSLQASPGSFFSCLGMFEGSQTPQDISFACALIAKG